MTPSLNNPADPRAFIAEHAANTAYWSDLAREAATSATMRFWPMRRENRRPSRALLSARRRKCFSQTRGTRMNSPLSLTAQAAIEFRREREAAEATQRSGPISPPSAASSTRSPVFIPAYKMGSGSSTANSS